MLRNILNLFMFISLLIVMNYRFTANIPHEILGVILGLAFLLHCAINRHWFKTFFKGPQNTRRVLLSVTNVLLLAAMLGSLVSGILISQYLFTSVSMRSILLHQLHTLFSYIGFILVAVHFGFHWNSLVNKIYRRLAIKPTSRLANSVAKAGAVIIIGFGIYASFINQIGNRLLMKHIIGWGMPAPNLLNFSLEYTAIFAMYALLTHYLLNFLKRT